MQASLAASQVLANSEEEQDEASKKQPSLWVISPFNVAIPWWNFLIELVVILWHLIFWVRFAYGPQS